MSSVIAFLRALVMVACLVAVPVLAISQGSTISRGLQAAARFLNRLSESPDEEPEPLMVSGALRMARPSPLAAARDEAAPHSSAGPIDGVASDRPSPGQRREAEGQVTPDVAGAENTDGPPPVRDVAVPSRAPARMPSRMTAWEETAAALRQLGALEYALEKWGDSGELYRFRCLVAVPGTASYQRHFHAVDADGGRAVERVVEQVRAWRASAGGAK